MKSPDHILFSVFPCSVILKLDVAARWVMLSLGIYYLGFKLSQEGRKEEGREGRKEERGRGEEGREERRNMFSIVNSKPPVLNLFYFLLSTVKD